MGKAQDVGAFGVMNTESLRRRAREYTISLRNYPKSVGKAGAEKGEILQCRR